MRMHSFKIWWKLSTERDALDLNVRIPSVTTPWVNTFRFALILKARWHAFPLNSLRCCRMNAHVHCWLGSRSR